MTNMEKYRMESYNSHAIGENKVKKGIAAKESIMASHGQGVTFSDSLKSITAQSVAAWTPEGEKTDAEETSADNANTGDTETPDFSMDALLEKFADYLADNATGENSVTDEEKLLAKHLEEESSNGKNKDDVALEYVEKLLEKQKKELEYFRREDYKDLINGETELQKLHDFLYNKRRVHETLTNLFEVVPPEVYAETKSVSETSEFSEASENEPVECI